MHKAEEDLLVLAAQNGNQQAFTLIYQEYQKTLLRYAFTLSGDQEIAQDALQEVWLKFASDIRKLKDPRVLRSWLYRLVRWRTFDLLRKSGRQRMEEEFDEGTYGETADENINDEEELNTVINRLPSLEKQMIHLFYLDELKVNEIAIVLDIPAGTVKSRLNRARNLLKQKFDH